MKFKENDKPAAGAAAAAFSEQEAEFEAQPWDIPMDIIVTEQKVYIYKQ